MCGIVGYIGKRPAVGILVQGLKSLEYRGYDSSGVAFVAADGKVEIRKSEGKLENVEKILGRRGQSQSRFYLRNRSHALGDSRETHDPERASSSRGSCRSDP